MNDYEKYVTEVNTIFSILEKTKNAWTNNDNLSSIEDINEFKKSVIDGASIIQKNMSSKVDSSEEMEE